MATLQFLAKHITIQPSDVYGSHVNNTRYFVWIGAAFHDWYEAMGLGLDSGRCAGPVMAHLAYDFRREMFHPGVAVVTLRVVRVGRSSLEHAIEVRDGTLDGPVCGAGKAVNVWRERDSGRTAPWPDEVLARCRDAAEVRPAG